MTTGPQTPTAAPPLSTEEKFRLRAREAPDAVAITDGTAEVTYADLDVLTDRLAADMRAYGITTERVVAVHVQRKIETAVAMLAVLKAGGVYLPLETAAPHDRLAFQLADSAAAVLFLGSEVADLDVDVPRIRWTWPVGALGAERAGHPPVTADGPGAAAAYILYTSGTTGRPKGVVVARDLLSEHLDAITAAFGLRPDDRILQFSPMHVDTAIEQTLTTLTLGATLVFIEETLTVSGMLDFLGRNRVTVSHLATGYWHVIANSLEWWAWPDIALRQMIVGGDRMSARAAALWLDRTSVPLINAYGPTETVITPNVCPVTEVDEELGAPIGDPVGARTMYVLDEDLRPCPRDVVGELYLGGRLLARGYAGRPGLTSRSFVPDPFSDVPGARLYRTGDLVRHGRDGRLFFVGRTDSQLKYHGYRIELGEIESVLATHPGVRYCAVVLREDRPGTQQLVAYVVAAHDGVRPTTLRAHLARRLPGHMLPTAISFLSAFPLTSNSKVDRRALSGPLFRIDGHRERGRGS
jgi:amino acid adenylation domain-containing protein